MNRKQFIQMSGLGSLASLTGCEGLDTSASAEGTRVQIIGAIVILARYKANQKQRTLAKARAGEVYVKKALNPAYRESVSRVNARQSSETRKVATVYRKKKQVAKKAPDPQAAVADIGVEEKAAVEEVVEQANREIATLNASWKQVATEATGNATPRGIQLESSGTARIATPSTRDKRNLMVASQKYSSAYIAVNVPPAGVKEERVSAATVMFWNVRDLELASSDAHVLNKAPRVGAKANFDGTKALYAGDGM